MPDCLAFGQSGTGMKKTNDAVSTQSGIFWSGTRIKLWMPALVSSMPMPSFDKMNN
jgi:hypothetical protein